MSRHIWTFTSKRGLCCLFGATVEDVNAMYKSWCSMMNHGEYEVEMYRIEMSAGVGDTRYSAKDTVVVNSFEVWDMNEPTKYAYFDWLNELETYLAGQIRVDQGFLEKNKGRRTKDILGPGFYSPQWMKTTDHDCGDVEIYLIVASQ